MKNNLGQAMVEAVFTIVFTTIIMFAFLQICIIAVDDMTANEAAFVGMRSAAVTKAKFRAQDAQKWAEKHLMLFFPLSSVKINFGLSSFTLSDKNTVKKFLAQKDDSQEETLDETSEENKSITLWNGDKKIKDYSGKNLTKQTVKIYYFTKVMFGSLVAPKNSEKYSYESGRRRYQSARSRMFPSPDEDFYNKAYPGAKIFKDKTINIGSEG